MRIKAWALEARKNVDGEPEFISVKGSYEEIRDDFREFKRWFLSTPNEYKTFSVTHILVPEDYFTYSYRPEDVVQSVFAALEVIAA